MDTRLLPPTPTRKRRTAWDHAVRFFACLCIVAVLACTTVVTIDTYPRHQLSAALAVNSKTGAVISVWGTNWQPGFTAWLAGGAGEGAHSVTIYVLPGHDQRALPPDGATGTKAPVRANGWIGATIEAHELPPGPYTVYVVSETDPHATASTNIAIQ